MSARRRRQAKSNDEFHKNTPFKKKINFIICERLILINFNATGKKSAKNAREREIRYGGTTQHRYQLYGISVEP
jgi:hypothetical protein